MSCHDIYRAWPRSGSAGGGTLVRNERRMLSVVTDAQVHDELRKDLGQTRVRVQADAGCRLEATGTKPADHLRPAPCVPIRQWRRSTSESAVGGLAAPTYLAACEREPLRLIREVLSGR
jgi:hypothetical protein